MLGALILLPALGHFLLQAPLITQSRRGGFSRHRTN
jgi:hypothetical protein